MCGISGVYSNGSAKGTELERAIGRMDAHQALRGPDDGGLFVSGDGAIAFGHRRLSIIDLSSDGHQPMERGDLAITFNGEIYNFPELKKELEAKGAKFKTRSDTEVILALFEAYGPASFSRLRGMFAFGLYDKKNRTLFLVRDRFGVKPLYFAERGGTLVFASTVGAIAASGLVPLSKNNDALALFLLFGSVPLPLTTWKEVEAVPDGSYLEMGSKGKKIVRYYDSVKFFAEAQESSPEYLSGVKNVLQDSVSAHLISDAPLGVFLSGGLDSSAIAALAAASREKPITTLSITFDEEEFSEERYQLAVANKIGSIHKSIRVRKEDFLGALDDVFSAMDQPTIDGVNTYFVSKAAKEAGLKAVLSGLGSDEIFLGYDYFRRAGMMKFIRKIPFSGLAAKLGGRYEKLEFLKASPLLGWYLAFRGVLPPSEASSVSGISKKRLLEILSGLEERLFGESREMLENMDPVQLLSYLEMKLYMQNQLLKDSDFMAMRHSVEIRVPFVDDRVVEYVARIAPDVKLRGPRNKQLLIDAVKDLIPTSVYERPKMGFTFPFQKWLSEANPKTSGGGHWSRFWATNVLARFGSRR